MNLLRPSSQQHRNNSLAVQATVQRMTLCSKPVEENLSIFNKEICFLLCVSRLEGQLIFQRSQKYYISLQCFEIQVHWQFFFVTVAKRLRPGFPGHFSPSASQVASMFLMGKKWFLGELGNWRKIRWQHFSKYNIRNTLSVHIYRRLGF